MQTKSKYQFNIFKNHMKFACLAVIIFVLLNSNCFGQSITWQRTYDGIDHVADGGYSICQADGENIYVCGYTTFLPNRKYLYLLKLDPLGDTIWTRSIFTKYGSNVTEGRSIVADGKGGCVITGISSNAFSVSFNKDGDTLWNKDYGFQDKQLYDIIKSSDGGYIACGRDYEGINDDAYILKIDTLGNLQWSKTFYSLYWKTFESIIESNNNDGYLIGGFNKNFQSDTSKAILLKIDQNGDSLWQKQFDLNVIFDIKTINKIAAGYLIGSTNFINNTVNYSILKVNESGNVLFQRTINSSNNQLILNDLKIIENNRYVIAARFGSIGHVFTIDSNGMVLREKFYNSPDFLTIRSVLPLSNGDILFAGEVDFDSIFTKKDVYVLRTDSLLNAPPPIGIQTQNTSVPEQYRLFQNFPNPFNPSTTINYEIRKSDHVSLLLYDITGKEISILVNESKNAGSYSFELSSQLMGLSSSIYFVTLSTGSGFSKTIKIILLK